MTADSSKVAILMAVGRRGVVADPKEIVTEVGRGHGVHNLVHQVWRLQKLGLVEFDEVKQVGRTIPRNIRLTARGREAARRIIEGDEHETSH